MESDHKYRAIANASLVYAAGGGAKPRSISSVEVISSPNAKKVRCPRESAAPKAYCSETTLFRDGTDQGSVQSVAPLKSAKLRTTELSTGKRAEFSGNYQKRPGETLRFVRLYMNQSAKLTGSSSPIIQSPFSSSSLCKPGFSPPGFSFAQLWLAQYQISINHSSMELCHTTYSPHPTLQTMHQTKASVRSTTLHTEASAKTRLA